MMSYDDILYEIEDGIATITLNRPQVMNALSPNLEAEIHRAFDEADADRDVRVIILTGSGAAFCSGYDQGPTETGRTRTDPTGQTIAQYIESWQRSDGETAGNWVHMWKLAKPIIAAVNGRLIPGSHLHRHRMHDAVVVAHTDGLRRVEDPDHPAFKDVDGEKDVCVRAGDLVMGDSRLLHSARANRTVHMRDGRILRVDERS